MPALSKISKGYKFPTLDVIGAIISLGEYRFIASMDKISPGLVLPISDLKTGLRLIR
jgi:hypothetical protein